MIKTTSTKEIASTNRATTGANYERITVGTVSGRFPAHLIHDGSEEVMAVFPVTTNGGQNATSVKGKGLFMNGSNKGTSNFANDSGSASRFFYCAKPGKSERDAGLEELEAIRHSNGNKWTDIDYRVARGEQSASAESDFRRNIHPTVKALKLMTYLCRLITPPDGLILDPFTGSGSTGCAAVLEGFNFLGMEQSEEYAEIARRRIKYWSEYTKAIPDDPQMVIPGME